MFSEPDDFASRFGSTGAVVDAVGELAQPVGEAADGSRSSSQVGGAHVDEPLDAARAQLLRGDRADAPQRVDRQLLQELLDALGRDHGQPVGLFQPEAIFARNLFGATPAEAVSRSSRGSRALSRCATLSPSGSPQAFSVTSR